MSAHSGRFEVDVIVQTRENRAMKLDVDEIVHRCVADRLGSG
jgi:hypothetical protein